MSEVRERRLRAPVRIVFLQRALKKFLFPNSWCLGSGLATQTALGRARASRAFALLSRGDISGPLSQGSYPGRNSFSGSRWWWPCLTQRKQPYDTIVAFPATKVTLVTGLGIRTFEGPLLCLRLNLIRSPACSAPQQHLSKEYGGNETGYM